MFNDINDGQKNASPFLQKQLNKCGEIHIPSGTYLLGETLRVHSDTKIFANPGATFILADGVGKNSGNFMIANANPGNGNSNIYLQGGVWDANNAGNPRGIDYDPFAYTGVAINFTNIQGLTLRDLTVHNPESFFVRIGEVCDFHIENINLSADKLRPNQDGIHVGGFSERGIIRTIRASGTGVPNDDMVALNADDDVERQLNLGMRRGPIRNLLVEDIESEDAYTFIRLLSVGQPIEDIRIQRLRGRCRVHGINLNNWRFPKGVGVIRRVRFADIDLTKTELTEWSPAIIKVSLNVDDIKIKRLQRGMETPSDVKTMIIDNRQRLDMVLEGETIDISSENGFILNNGDIKNLQIHDKNEDR
jgi:hypothetical protein